jgi:hypothetical protein
MNEVVPDSSLHPFVHLPHETLHRRRPWIVAGETDKIYMPHYFTTAILITATSECEADFAETRAR